MPNFEFEEVERYRIDKLKRLVKDSNWSESEKKTSLKFIYYFLELTGYIGFDIGECVEASVIQTRSSVLEEVEKKVKKNKKEVFDLIKKEAIPSQNCLCSEDGDHYLCEASYNQAVEDDLSIIQSMK